MRDPSEWLEEINEYRKPLDRWWERTKVYCQAYNGVFPRGFESPDISNNFVYRGVEAYIEHLFFRTPTLEFPIKKGVDAQTQAASGALMNWVIRSTKTGEKFTEVIRDALLKGRGVMKIGYHSDVVDLEEIERLQTDALAENDRMMRGEDIEVQEGENHDDHIAAHRGAMSQDVVNALYRQYGPDGPLRITKHIEEHQKAKDKEKKRGKLYFDLEPEEVWTRYVDPRDMIIGGGALCMDDAPWIAFKSTRKLRAVKNDPAYSRTAGLEGSLSVSPHIAGEDAETITTSSSGQSVTANTGSSFEEKDDDKWVELFEIWDKETQRFYVICPEMPDVFLLNEETPFPRIPGFFPCVELVFHRAAATGNEEEDATRCYGRSLAQAIWPEQMALNRLQNLLIERAKLDIPKFLAHPTLTKKTVEAMALADVGGVTHAEFDGGTPPDNLANVLFGYSSLAQGSSVDLLKAIQMLQDIIMSKLGLGEVVLSQQSNANTATAAELLATSASAILDTALEKIINSFTQLSRVMFTLVAQFYSTGRAVSVAGKDGEAWDLVVGKVALMKVNGQDIRIRTASTSAAIDAMKRNQAMQLYQLLAPDPLVKRRELLLHVLGQMGVPRDMPFLKTDEELRAEQIQAMQDQAALAQATGGAQPQGQPPAGAGPIRPADNTADLISQMRGAAGGDTPAARLGGATAPQPNAVAA